jgi:hypothetical protein
MHLAVHGTSRQLALNGLERALYGTPGWAKLAAFDTSLHAATEFNRIFTDQNRPAQIIVIVNSNGTQFISQ